MKYLQQICILSLLLISGPFVFGQSIKEGKNLLEKESFGAAKKIFKQIIATKANDPEAYFYLGEVYLKTEKPDSAKWAYEKGMAENSKAGLNYVGLGKYALMKNNPIDAKVNFDKAIKVSKSKDANIFYELGVAHLDQEKKDAKAAIGYLEQARNLNINDPNIYSTLGDAYLENNEGGPAVSAYERAIEKDKNNPTHYFKRAKVFSRAKAYEEAIKSMEQCIVLDPNYAPAYKELVDLYQKDKQFDKVSTMLKKYVSLQENDVDARIRLVKYLIYNAKDYDNGLAEAKKVMELSPNNPTMYRWIAWAQLEKGNFQEAFNASENFIKYAEKSNIYAFDYENYAQSALKVKKESVAVEAYNKILEMDPSKVEYYGKLADLYRELGNQQGALDAYKMKIAKSKASATDYFYIGNAYLALDKYKEADTAYIKMIDLNPTWAPGYIKRAEVANKMDPDKKLGLAVPFYEQFLAKGDSTKHTRDFVVALNYLSSIAMERDDYSGAKQQFNRLLGINPDPNKYRGQLLNAYNNLGFISYKEGNKPLAIDYYRKALALDPTNEDIKKGLKGLGDKR
jgi:tetratricopeptide (TPR) repeat protein